MKATVTAEALASASDWIGRIVPSRPTVPILAGVVIDATSSPDRDEVELAAFDYDTAGRARLGAGVVSVDEPERVVVPGRLLAAVSKAIGSGQQVVSLSVEDRRLVVAVGAKSRWSMPLLPADDYPALPDQAPVVGEIPAAALIDAVKRVVDSASTDAGLPMLTGVAVLADREQLTMVATDRFRIAICETAWTATDDVAQVLAPASLMRFAATAVAGASGPVQVRCGDGMLGFGTDERSVSGRLLAGEFPRWRNLDVTPESAGSKFRASVVVDGAALREAASRAAVMLDRTKPHLRVAVTPGEVTLSASGEDVGDAVHEAATVSHDGDSVAVQGNGDFLRHAIATCGDAAVRVDVGKDRVLLRPATGEGQVVPGHRATVMAIKFPNGQGVEEL